MEMKKKKKKNTKKKEKLHLLPETTAAENGGNSDGVREEGGDCCGDCPVLGGGTIEHWKICRIRGYWRWLKAVVSDSTRRDGVSERGCLPTKTSVVSLASGDGGEQIRSGSTDLIPAERVPARRLVNYGDVGDEQLRVMPEQIPRTRLQLVELQSAERPRGPGRDGEGAPVVARWCQELQIWTQRSRSVFDAVAPVKAANSGETEATPVVADSEQIWTRRRRRQANRAPGKRVLQDFNIAKEANGTGKEVIMTFKADVDVTLEIHLQWVGKGTISVPRRSVYGPLISAISVTPNFDPDTGDGSKLSVGAIVGIVAAVCVVILLSSAILWICLRRRNDENSELRGVELQTGHFSLRQIKSATSNFDDTNKIGEGGFGPVYRGVLPDGTEIAVKQLSSKSKQGNREFLNEIGMISALEHPNLVKLYGCCIDGNQLLLIYEYLENNSLARALFGPEASRLNLDWKTRRKICLGIARGLTYLHEESRLKVVHRDIKATNVLLDRHLNAKISDFGLAKLDEEENTHISTRIAGTVGYMAPEYAMRGYLTDKADVYSFGVVMLEIVSGTSNTNYKPKEEFMYLLDWAYVLEEKGTLLELVDSKLGSNYSREEALQMLNLALLCTNPSPTLRPQMSRVVSMLDGRALVQVPSAKGKASNHGDARFKSFEKLSHDSQTPSISTDGPWTGSSVSHQSRTEKDPVSESRTLSDSTD